MTAATAACAEARITPAATGLRNDTQSDAWIPVVAAIHGCGALAATGVHLASRPLPCAGARRTTS